MFWPGVPQGTDYPQTEDNLELHQVKVPQCRLWFKWLFSSSDQLHQLHSWVWTHSRKFFNNYICPGFKFWRKELFCPWSNLTFELRKIMCYWPDSQRKHLIKALNCLFKDQWLWFIRQNLETDHVNPVTHRLYHTLRSVIELKYHQSRLV